MMKSKQIARDEFSNQWDNYLREIVSNIRQLRLLLNDISVTSPLVAGDIYPPDLIAITAVQRFNPDLYRAIYNNSSALTLAQSWIRNRDFTTVEEAEALNRRALTEIEAALSKSRVADGYWKLLEDIFPKAKELRSDRKKREYSRLELDEARRQRRIAHPDYFPIYFKFQVPETIASSRELKSFYDLLGNANSEDELTEVFRKKLSELPKGNLKRYDVLERLSEDISRLVHPKWTAMALSRLADQYSYDLMDVGEAALALNGVFRFGKSIGEPKERTQYFARCLDLSSDDTFAVRILYTFEQPEHSRNRGVSVEDIDLDELQRAFRKRMVRRYVNAPSAATMDISTGDPLAFWRWSDMSTGDHHDVVRFWRRYVAQRKQRLADIVNMFFVRFAWKQNPAEYVRKIFTDHYVLHALSNFAAGKQPINPDLEPALVWLRQYRDGEFEKGVPFPWSADRE